MNLISRYSRHSTLNSSTSPFFSIMSWVVKEELSIASIPPIQDTPASLVGCIPVSPSPALRLQNSPKSALSEKSQWSWMFSVEKESRRRWGRVADPPMKTLSMAQSAVSGPEWDGCHHFRRVPLWRASEGRASDINLWWKAQSFKKLERIWYFLVKNRFISAISFSGLYLKE